MKNKAFEALLILVFASSLLVGFSFLIGLVNIPWVNGKTVQLKFIDKKSLFDFSVVNTTNSADSLINNYMSDSTLAANNLKFMNEQIRLMSDDSIKILEVVNKNLNFFLTIDTVQNEKNIKVSRKDAKEIRESDQK